MRRGRAQGQQTDIGHVTHRTASPAEPWGWSCTCSEVTPARMDRKSSRATPIPLAVSRKLLSIITTEREWRAREAAGGERWRRRPLPCGGGEKVSGGRSQRFNDRTVTEKKPCPPSATPPHLQEQVTLGGVRAAVAQ